ncbi:hypothetical protein KKG16_04225 [Patescibacteria group bacterium]|nr:hypothetical protein [Patescibacteria group bacterium]
MNSKEYADAQTQIINWKTRIKQTKNKDELITVRLEASTFFSSMEKQDPELFNVLKINFKELLELDHKKLTGQNIVID